MTSVATDKKKITNDSSTHTGKPAVKTAYSDKERNDLVAALNQALADYSVHYQKLRNYHWNVKGDNFFDLHEQFEILYNEARLNIDEIAERIRVFGDTPYSTMKEYLAHSTVKETGSDLSWDRMVEEVLNDFKILLGHLEALVLVAMSLSDGGTEEMAKDFIKKIEKHRWMLSAFYNK